MVWTIVWLCFKCLCIGILFPKILILMVNGPMFMIKGSGWRLDLIILSSEMGPLGELEVTEVCPHKIVLQEG